MTKIPIRQCMICRKREPKDTLFRVVFDSDKSQLFVDEERRSRGRSFYVHQSIECCSKVPDAGRVIKALRLSPGDVTKEMVTESFLKMRESALKVAIS